MTNQLVTLICGGGAGAHVTAGIAASQPGVEVRVLTLNTERAEIWTNAMKDHDFTIKYLFGKNSSEDNVLITSQFTVSSEPEMVVPGADVIILTMPAFNHEKYLAAIEPYLKPGMVLVGLPGQAGFEFAVWRCLGAKAQQVSQVSFDSLPWACRITHFGRAAEIHGTKMALAGAYKVGMTRPKQNPSSMIQRVFGQTTKLNMKGHLLGINLNCAYLHPAISYSFWSRWSGEPLASAPAFYSGIDQSAATIVSQLGDEALAIAASIMALREDVDLSNVMHIYDFYLRSYPDDIKDKTSLYSCLKTNAVYNGFTHPCVNTSDDKYKPDFDHRYYTEDVPFGLVVMKGIASLAGVSTHTIDRVIMWAQECMDKEYLKDGELTGKDIGESRAPQKYGINTLDALLAHYLPTVER